MMKLALALSLLIALTHGDGAWDAEMARIQRDFCTYIGDRDIGGATRYLISSDVWSTLRSAYHCRDSPKIKREQDMCAALNRPGDRDSLDVVTQMYGCFLPAASAKDEFCADYDYGDGIDTKATFEIVKKNVAYECGKHFNEAHCLKEKFCLLSLYVN